MRLLAGARFPTMLATTAATAQTPGGVGVGVGVGDTLPPRCSRIVSCSRRAAQPASIGRHAAFVHRVDIRGSPACIPRSAYAKLAALTEIVMLSRRRFNAGLTAIARERIARRVFI